MPPPRPTTSSRPTLLLPTQASLLSSPSFPLTLSLVRPRSISERHEVFNFPRLNLLAVEILAIVSAARHGPDESTSPSGLVRSLHATPGLRGFAVAQLFPRAPSPFPRLLPRLRIRIPLLAEPDCGSDLATRAASFRSLKVAQAQLCALF